MKLTNIIKAIPIFGSLAQKIYSRLMKTHLKNPADWIPIILDNEDAVVVQIGSNDGKTGDPIYDLLLQKKKWKALFVEPVPFLFERLKSNYSGDARFSFSNSVINEGKDVTFYWVREEAKQKLPDLPVWYDQLGGFSREHITDHLPELEDYIEEAALSGMTLSTLFENFEIEKLDLLHIDTEGADYKILSQLDLSKYSPEVILYERKHLSEEEESSSIVFLKDQYVMFNLDQDILAIRNEKYAEVAGKLGQLNSLKIRYK